MDFAVESWSPEYGVAADQTALVDTGAVVDATVEVALLDWAPRRPAERTVVPRSLAFVDGVRRIDARVWVRDGDTSRPGVCASVAAGVVVADGRARVVDCAVARAVVTAAGSAGPIVTRQGTYELRPVGDDGPEAHYLGVHDVMTELEVRVSEGLDCDLVVVDGPLRGRRRDRTVGYIKTQQVQYLPDPAHAVLGRLGVGERTPVFLIDQRGMVRWSWYLRLPGPVSHPLSALVRCETPGVGTVAEAAATADAVSAALPRFASEAHKDARAPQNLYPIAGLESELRRRLGDPLLAERALRLAAAR